MDTKIRVGGNNCFDGPGLAKNKIQEQNPVSTEQDRDFYRLFPSRNP